MKNLKNEFYEISEEFYKIKKYRNLKDDIHHGLSRISHMQRVAIFTFFITKLFKLDYISATRGAFMHDFFSDTEIDRSNFIKAVKKHPRIAYMNSKKHFKINEVEKDIILKHMYPFTKSFPKYKESLIVCICDNVASIYEFFRYQLQMSLTVMMLFVINTIR